MSEITFITKNAYSYERLKEEIITGILKPGEKLVVSSLSKRYNVSAMPIREALLRLEQEGLVHSTPHMGARVHKCDYNQFYELIQVSVALETCASQLAAAFMTDEGFSNLEGLLRGMESACESGDVSTYQVLNNEFHMCIYRAAGNQELFDLIRNIHNRTYPYTSIAIHTEGRLSFSLVEHHEWLTCLRARDSKHSADVCRKQRLESYYLFLDYLASCLDGPETPQKKFYIYSFSDAFSGMSRDEILASIEQYRKKMAII